MNCSYRSFLKICFVVGLYGCNYDAPNDSVAQYDSEVVDHNNDILHLDVNYKFPKIRIEISNKNNIPVAFRLVQDEFYDLRIEAWRHHRGVVLLTPKVFDDLNHYGFRGYPELDLLPGESHVLMLDLLKCVPGSEDDQDLAKTIVSPDGYQPTHIYLLLRYRKKETIQTGSISWPYVWKRID